MEETDDSTGQVAVIGRDWTKGSIVHNLLSLSWPIIVNKSLNMLGPTIDVIWIGRLGVASLAGVGIAGTAVLVVQSAMFGLVTGVRAMVARFMGTGDARGASHVTRQAFVASASYSIVMAAIGIFFAESILIVMGLEADVVAEGAAYMRIVLVGSVAMSFRLMTEGIMQASGDVVTPMRIAVFFRLFHLALCPFMVFGWWIFPRMGVSGAAMSGVISQSLGMGIGLWVLFSGRSRLWLTLRNFRLDLNIIWRILKIGIPAYVAEIERNLGALVLMWIMVPFGTMAVAAHTLYRRMEHVLVMPSKGVGVGAAVLVGQNLGARQPERAERSGWLAMGLVESFMVACSMAILLWAEYIISIFSTEPDLVELASIFMRIAAAGYLVLGITAVLENCVSGAGDTVMPMLATLLTIWAVQLPLAFFLPQVTNLGVYGVRWAIVISMVVAALGYVLYFRLGRWKRKKV